MFEIKSEIMLLQRNGVREEKKNSSNEFPGFFPFTVTFLSLNRQGDLFKKKSYEKLIQFKFNMEDTAHTVWWCNVKFIKFLTCTKKKMYGKM